MKAIEVKLKKNGFRFNTTEKPPKSHYKFLMRLGRVFPSTKAQAQYFISYGAILDVLNKDDVDFIESILNKHGFYGIYKYTKSKTWVRLQNFCDLYLAVEKEFNLKL